MTRRRTLLFGLLNLVQGAVIGCIPLFVASREPLVNGILIAVGATMIIAGPALTFGGRLGTIIAAIACITHGITGTVTAALIIGSGAYLYSIYGTYGRTAGFIAFALAGTVLAVFWLIPAHELKFLKQRLEQK